MVNVKRFLLHCISEDFVSLWFVLNFRYLENFGMKFIQNIYSRCNFPFCLHELKTSDSSEALKSCLCLTGTRDLQTASFDPTPKALFSGLCSYLGTESCNVNINSARSQNCKKWLLGS